MLKAVLESVSEMLESALTEPESSPSTRQVYISCAKTLLDKAIFDMDEDAPKRTPIPVKKKRELPLGAEEGKEYMVDVDPITKVLKSIKANGKEIDDDAMVQLNGVAMPYIEAKGKPFQTGGVL